MVRRLDGVVFYDKLLVESNMGKVDFDGQGAFVVIVLVRALRLLSYA